MAYGDPSLRRPKPPFVPDAGQIGDQLRREKIDRRTRWMLQQHGRLGMRYPPNFLFDTRMRTEMPWSQSYWRDYVLPRMGGTRPPYTRGLLGDR
jgi:hypothetical protein